MDPETKVYSKGDRIEIFGGYANVQELGLRDRLRYQSGGLETQALQVDLRIWFSANVQHIIEVDDLGEVRYPDGTLYQFKVTGLNKNDGAVYCQYISGKSE